MSLNNGSMMAEVIADAYDRRPQTPADRDIILTVGPFTDDPSVMRGLAAIPNTIFRVNGGQNTDEEAATRISLIHQAAEDVGVEPRILFDVPGAKLRVGKGLPGYVEVNRGDLLHFQFEDAIEPGDTSIIPVQHDFSVAKEGHHMLMHDGKSSLRIVGVDKERHLVTAESEFVGRFGPNQGLNMPETSFVNGYISEDTERVRFIATQPGIRYLVASYVQSPEDVVTMGQDADRFGLHTKLGAKIEDKTGMTHAAEIAEPADLIVVAQGDMGPEIGRELIFSAMCRLAHETNGRRKELAVATGMMESTLGGNPASPADLGYTALAAIIGAKVWVSAETAMSPYALETARTLRKQVDFYADALPMLVYALPKDKLLRAVQPLLTSAEAA